MIRHIVRNKPLILVEHSTEACNIDIMNEDIKKFMLSYGGSETIFYHLKKIKYDKIRCIDNRLELNLLSASEETTFFEKLLSQKDFYINEHILAVILIIKKQIDLISNFNEYFQKTVYYEIYNIYKIVLNRQIKIVLLFIKNLENNENIFKEKIINENNWVVFILTILNILKNLKIFGSIVVDINILNNITKSRSRNIILYTGINHAVRIAQILKNKGFSLKIVKGGEMDLDSCNPYPLYDEQTELLLLASLIQNIK